MGNPEIQHPIEKPVTRDALKKVAEAGYPVELQRAMGLVDRAQPITLDEGVELVITAIRIEAGRLEKEADILEELADQSDDPKWQELFAPRARALKMDATKNRDEADERQSAKNEFYRIR